MPPLSGTSDGSETSPTHDSHKVTRGNGWLQSRTKLIQYTFYNFATEVGESSARSRTDDDESFYDPLSTSPARPSLLSCKNYCYTGFVGV